MDNEPKQTILIVDDNHNNLSVLYDQLTEFGYRAITAEKRMSQFPLGFEKNGIKTSYKFTSFLS
ncbi:MAG: hypothetical protein KDK90_23005, partial [Leptospiraceae bacterium]|nr:hypothetical protein [Leptospiraceae bacterium]